MLTSDFNKNDKVNESESTFLGNNQSFRQQIDLLTNLMPVGGGNGETSSFKRLKQPGTSNLGEKERMNTTK